MRVKVDVWHGGENLVASKQLELVYRHHSFELWFTLSLSGVLAVALWPRAEHAVLLVWMLALWLVMAVREFYARKYLGLAREEIADPEKWQIGMVVGAIVTGLCWGFSVLSVTASPLEPAVMLLLFALAGVSAFAGNSMAAMPMAVRAFLLTALLPAVFWLFSFGERAAFFMGMMALGYLGLMLLLAHQSYLTIRGLLADTAKNGKFAGVFSHVVVPERKHALFRGAEDTISVRERESRQQALFLQSLLSGLRDAGIILVVVEDGRFVYTNDHYVGCNLGYAKGQLPETVSFLELIHPDDRPRIIGMHRDRLEGKPVPTTYEVGALGGDGSRREYEFHVTLVPDSDPPQTLLLALDIAARKRAEEELQRREREFRTLVENTPDVVVRYDRECRRIYVNSAWEMANGMSARDVIGKSPQELSVRVKPIAADFERMLRGVMESGCPDSMELNWRDQEGGQVYFELNAIPEFDGNGAAVSVLTVARDITEHRRMEAELLRGAQEYRSLTENLPDNIARMDAAGRVLYSNPTHQRSLGKTAAEMVGKTYGELFPDGRYAPVEAAIAQVVATGQPVLFVRQPVPFENGETRIHDVNLVPERDVDGNVISVLGIGRDMTEIYRLQDEVGSRERELRALADSSPGMMGAFYSRPDGSVCMPYVSPNIEELFGLRPQDVVNDASPLLALNHPDDAQRVVESIAESARNMTVWHEEYRIFHPTRGERWMESHARPELHPDGGVVWYGYIHDITGRKRTEMELHRREREFRALAENSPDPIYRYNRDGRRLYANSMACRLSGKPDAELIGKLFVDDSILIPEQRPKLLEAIQRVFDCGESIQLDLGFVIGTDYRDYQMRLVPERDAFERVVSVLAIARDITELKDAQRQAEQFVANFPGFVYSYRMTPDGHGSFPFASPGIEKLYGLNPADVKDDSAALHALAHPDDAPGIIDALVESARTMSPIHMQYRICRPGLPERWTEFRSCPVREADGSIVWHGIMVDIDERKRAAEALEESERRMARYFASTPGYFQMTELRADGSYAVPFASDGIVDLFGLKPDDVKENVTALAALNHPDDAEMVFRKAAESARDLTPYQVEYRILHPQKGLRWIECIGSPERLVDGGTRWYGFMHDITERKRAGEQLVASQKMLADAQKIARLGSWNWDVVADRVEWSEMAYEIYTPDKRPAAPGFGDFTSSLHPDDLERVVAAVQSAFERDTPFDLDHRVVSVSRGVRTVHAYGKVFRDASGKPVRMVGTVQDITERKQFEIELQNNLDRIFTLNETLEQKARELEEQAVELEMSKEQLQQTEAWYRSILHSAPDGMLVVDSRGFIMQANAQLEAMFGYGSSELIGCNVDVLLPQAARAAHAEKRAAFASGGERDRRMAGVAQNLFGCRKDGSEFPVDVSLSRLPDLDGRQGAICAAVRDVTERRKMDAARETALSEALRLAQLRSVFMAQMSHELRTPLNGILGYAQNLLQGGSLGEKQLAGLHIIRQSGEHLLSLINGILDHAAIEADKFELIRGDIELEPFLSTLIGIIRVRAEQKNIAFSCEAGTDLPAVVRGDAQRLRQILLNLLSNAVKFTDSGYVILRVQHPAPSLIRFEVSDSGVGIAADQLENIFLPFEQTGEASRRAGGNGLGLAISRKLVRLMGGDIKVESRPGEGSTFSFEIDMEAARDGADKVNSAALEEQAATYVTEATPLVSIPSRKELDVLHDFALRGNMRSIVRYAEQLAETDSRYIPFAGQLRQLAKNFQTKALTGLIEQYRNEKELER